MINPYALRITYYVLPKKHMQNSDKTEQIFEMSNMEKVWLNRVSENVWIYRIAASPEYLSKTRIKLLLSILLSIVLIIAGMILLRVSMVLQRDLKFSVLLIKMLQEPTVANWQRFSILDMMDETLSYSHTDRISFFILSILFI